MGLFLGWGTRRTNSVGLLLGISPAPGPDHRRTGRRTRTPAAGNVERVEMEEN